MANGSRLYFANLTGHFSSKHSEQTFKGVEAIGVSRVDIGLADTPAQQGATLADKDAWEAPTLIAPGGAGFTDKEQVWADNAASSDFFGNAYVCFGNFVGGPSFGSNAVRPRWPAPSTAGRPGARRWSSTTRTPASGKWALKAGATGCTIRTDSEGTVYLSTGLQPEDQGAGIFLSRSFDGGATFEPRRFLFKTQTAGVFDPVVGRFVMDGVAGARADLEPAPSVDIANGSPTGAGATDQIVMTWIDGETLNDEHVKFSTSTDDGDTWLSPAPSIESNGGDRGFYTAPAISPTARTCGSYTTRSRSPSRPARSVRRTTGPCWRWSFMRTWRGCGGAFSELHRSTPGDARGSSQNNLVGEFLGDYVYASARNGYVATVWNDVRDTANCAAIDEWRMTLQTKTQKDAIPTPEPNNDCPPAANWGDSSIYGAAIADPTP